MKKIVLLLDSHADIFLRHALSLCVDYRDLGVEVEVWDVANLGFPQWGVHNRNSLVRLFDSTGARVIFPNLSKPKAHREVFSPDISTRISRYAVERLKGEVSGRRCSKFALHTYLRGTVKKSVELRALLAERAKEVSTVIVRNGRSPWQVALMMDEGFRKTFEVLFYDFPFFWGRDYVFKGQYHVHDRVNYQLAALAEHSTHDLGLLDKWAATHKVFMREKWDFNTHESLRKNLILTSSTFEFNSMPDIWSYDDGRDQYDRFSQFLDEKDSTGKETTLRVHPNLRNAPWRIQLEDWRRIKQIKERHPDLLVHMHFDTQDTYALMENAETVVVSISTAGLEAIARGKKVVAVNPTFYDIVCDVDNGAYEQGTGLTAAAGAAAILGHLLSLSKPSPAFFDDRTLWTRIRHSLVRNPFLSLFSLHIQFSNKLSATCGLALVKLFSHLPTRRRIAE